MNTVLSNIIELQDVRKLVITQVRLDLENLADTEIAAETLYSTISPGTEVAAYTGQPPLRPGPMYPRVVGYCNVAEVVAVGAAVKEYRSGDRILTFQSHRSAFICQEDSIILRLPETLDALKASTTYLYHLGYSAILRGGLLAGSTVAVIGLGTLGLTTVALARLSGMRVYAFTDQETKHGVAREFGACRVFAKDDPDAASIILTETGGIGVDVVVTTSNSWSDWRHALALPRQGGKICVLGFPGRGQNMPAFNPLDSQYFYDKDLTILSCGYCPDAAVAPWDIRFTIKRNCAYLAGLIGEGRLPTDQLISSVVAWHRVEEIYRRLADRDAALLSAALKWKGC